MAAWGVGGFFRSFPVISVECETTTKKESVAPPRFSTRVSFWGGLIIIKPTHAFSHRMGIVRSASRKSQRPWKRKKNRVKMGASFQRFQRYTYPLLRITRTGGGCTQRFFVNFFHPKNLGVSNQSNVTSVFFQMGWFNHQLRWRFWGPGLTSTFAFPAPQCHVRRCGAISGIVVIPLGGWGWDGMGWWKIMKSMGIPPSEDDGMKEMNTYYLKVQGEHIFFLSPTPPFFLCKDW